MKTADIVLLFVLLAEAASAQQQGTRSYTPERKLDAPTFMNAEVVRVDRGLNHVTFRSESGETTLTVEGEALANIASLHTGDKVIVTYRVAKDTGGREIRYVTSVKPGSPTSGDPRRVTMASGSTLRGRVLNYHRNRRRVTVIDETGNLRTLGLDAGVTGVETLQPGANVAFTLGAAGANVSGLTSLGSTSVFAPGVGFPPVSGRFVSFNQRTGVVTLDTTNAGRVAFPVGSNVAGGLSGLRSGENLSLNFDVANQTGVGAGNPPFVTINGVQRVNQQAAQQGTQQSSTQQQATQQQTAQQQTAQQTAQQQAAQQQAAQQAAQRNQQASQPPATQPGAQQGTQSGQPTTPGGTVGGTTGAQVSPPLAPAPVSPTGSSVLPPATAKQAASVDQVGTMRAQGEADLNAAAMALSATANAIDPVWARYKAHCMGGVSTETSTSGREWSFLVQGRSLPTPSSDDCRGLNTDLTNQVNGFVQQLEIVEDAARKAEVLPGRVREVLDRHRLR